VRVKNLRLVALDETAGELVAGKAQRREPPPVVRSSLFTTSG
jgi:hypothetical protein